MTVLLSTGSSMKRLNWLKVSVTLIRKIKNTHDVVSDQETVLKLSLNAEV